MPGLDFSSSLDYRGFTEGAKKIQDSISLLSGQLSSLGDVSGIFNRMSSETDSATQSANRLSMAFGSFFEQFTAANLAIDAFYKVTGAINQAGDTIVSFQQKNSMLGAILGESAESIAEMTEQAKELGRQTIFTSSNVTDLQIELSKLGFEKKAIQEMTDSVLAFAQATGGDLGDAAALTGAALRMFGAQTDEANRYTNAMARATTASALNFQAIRDNLATFGPMAHSLGMEIEDVLALFGTLKNAGIEGSTAMTSLRNIFTRIAQGKIQGFEGGVKTLDEFVSKLKQLENIEPGKAMKQAGTRGGTQFMTLIQQADKIIELRDKIKEASAEDTTGDMAEQMTQNVAGAVKRMQSAWEGFVLSFSNITGPWATVVDEIADGINKVTDLISTGSTVSMGAISAIMAGMGSLVTMYGVKNGVQAVSAALTERQAQAYMAAATAMEQALVLKTGEIHADLQDAVAKGRLTQQQAISITALMKKVDAERLDLEVKQLQIKEDLRLIEAEIATANERIKSATATQVEAEEGKRLVLIQRQQLLSSELVTTQTKIDSLAQSQNTIAKLGNAGATLKLKAAMDMLGVTMLANPYVLAAAAIAGLVYVIMSANEAILTHEEAQKTLSDAYADYNKRLDEQERMELDSIKTIKSKTSTILEQAKAYQQLAENKYLASYSLEEIKNMDDKQIQVLMGLYREQQQEEYLRNMAAATEELRRLFASKGAAWATAGEDEDIDRIIEKYHLAAEEAEKIKEAIKGFTNLKDFSITLSDAAADALKDYIAQKAEAGVVEGFKNGFSNKELQRSAEDMMDGFTKAMEDGSKKIEWEIERTQKRIEELRQKRSETSDANKAVLYSRDIEALESKLTALNERLIGVRNSVFDSFKEGLNPMIAEAERRVKKLNDDLLAATGDKKAKIEAEFTAASNDLATLRSMMSFFEAAVTQKDLVINIQTKRETEALGEDFIVELGNEYDKVQAMATDVIRQVTLARKEVEDLQKNGVKVTSETAKEIAETYGLTANNIKADFKNAEKSVEDDIEKLKKKLLEAKTESERNKIRLQIADKENELAYIRNLRKNLVDMVANPYNVLVNVSVKVKGITQKMKQWLGLETDAEREKREKEEQESGRKETVKEVRDRQRAERAQDIQRRKDEFERNKAAQEAKKKEEAKELSEKEKKEAAKRAKEMADQQAKEREQRMKFEDEMLKTEQSAQDARIKARIAGIKNEYERGNAEREYQHKKSLNELLRQSDEVYKKIYEQRKTEYENKNKGKRYVNTEEGAAGWKGVKRTSNVEVVTVTDDQGKERKILVTPILPNGQQLTQQQLDEYIENTLTGAKDINAADKDGKNIVIGVDIDGKAATTLKEVRTLVDGLDSFDSSKLEATQKLIDGLDLSSAFKSADEAEQFKNTISGTFAKAAEENEKYKRVTEETRKKELSDIKEFFKQYGNYEEKKKIIEEDGAKEQDAIAKKREATVKELEKARADGNKVLENELSEQLQMYDRQVDLSKQNTAKNLDDLEREYSDFYRKLSEDRSDWIVGDVAKLLEEAEERLQAIADDPALSNKDKEIRIKNLKREIKSLKSELSQKFNVTGILKQLLMPSEGEKGESKSFGERLKGIADAWKEMSSEEKWGVVGGFVTSIANGMQRAAEYMKELAEVSGDSGLAETADEMSAMAQNLNAAGQGAASGGWIGAIVGGVSDILNQTIEAFVGMALAEEQAKKEALKLRDAMELVNIEMDKVDYDTVFGSKNVQKARDYYKKLAQYEELYRKAIEKDDLNSAFLSYTGSDNKFIAEREALEKRYSGLKAMSVKTKDYSGWANFWGIDDEYMNLGDLAPELWDENGELVIEKAEKFLEVNDQISDEQREQIQNIVDLKKKYEEVLEVIDNTISSTFGSLASDIADIVWDSVASGKDSWREFKRIGSDVIDDLGKQLLQEMLITEYFEQFRDRMRDAYKLDSSVAVQQELLNITNDILNGMGGVLLTAEEVAKNMQKWKKDNGYDVDGGETFQKMAGNFKSALLDMKSSARDVSKDITKILYEQLVEKLVFNKRVKVEIDGKEQVFRDLEEYEKDWGDRVDKIMNTDTSEDRIQKIREAREESTGYYNKYKEAEKAYEDLKKQASEWYDSRTWFAREKMEEAHQKMAELEAQIANFGVQTPGNRLELIMLQADLRAYTAVYDKYNAELNSANEEYNNLWGERLKQSREAMRIAQEQFQAAEREISEMYQGDLITEEEREQALKELYAEKERVYNEMKSSIKTISDMIGWSMELAIDSSAFANIGEDLLSSLKDTSKGVEEFKQDIVKSMTDDLIDEIFYSNPDFEAKMREFQERYVTALSNKDKEALQQIADDLAEYADGVAEAVESINKSMGNIDMTTPLDDMRSSFRDSLMNMEDDADAFAADINKILTEAFIDDFVLGDAFDAKLEEWKKEYRRIKNSDISEEERARQLRQLQESITSAKEDYTMAAREIQDFMAYGEYQDQAAKVNMADKATYDQFETYLGIALSQQIAMEQGNIVRQQILSTLQSMASLSSPDGNVVNEIKGQLIIANGHLLEISQATKGAYNKLNDHLESIDNKLTQLNKL